MDIEDLKKKLIQIETKRTLLREERKKKLEKKEYWTNRHRLASDARVFAQSVAQKLQSSIEFRISDIVTSAIQEVFPDDPYEFIVRFVSRRGKSECDLLFSKNGNEIKPLESCGYGACNIATITSRLALWSLNKNRPLFILDEPLPQLSEDRCDDASMIISSLCRKLNIQIIMVSHDPEIINYADNVIQI